MEAKQEFLQNLINTAEKVAAGDFTARVTEEYSGELGVLGAAFNKMVKAVEERYKQIQEEAKEQILRSEKMASIGRLSAGIAHELNNPLTGILTYGSMMLEELKDTKYAEDLTVITDETVRCRDIVRGLLDFSRDKKLDLRPYSLTTLVSEAVSLLEKTNGFKDVTIQKELDISLPETNMDITQMRSVVNNLIMNAVDAMHGKGTLALKTQYVPDSNSVCLSVTDNGTGINKDNIAHIFEPFFTTKVVGKGTGLGLFVTYSIVENHGGSINVESEEGKGTEFTVRLPVK